MGMETSAKDIGKMVFVLLVMAGIATLLVPVLMGAGSKAATAMSVDLTGSYNATKLSLENTTSAQGTVFQFLPWLGVGFVIMGAFGLKRMLSL